MRKIKYLFMAILITITSMLSFGCANTNNRNINLMIWCYYNNTQLTAFKNYVNEFNNGIGKDKNIYVDTKTYGGVTELSTELINSSEKKVGAAVMPNMFQSYADDLIMLDEKYHNVAALDKYFTQADLANYNADFLNEGRYDAEGSLKLIPIAKSTEIFMLNKTAWDSFVEDCPEVTLEMLNTIEGLTAVAEKYYNHTGKAFYGRDAMANYIYINAKSLGEEIFINGDDGLTINMNEDVFKKLYDNYYVPYVKGWFDAKERFRSNDVQLGNIVCYSGSTASAGYFPNDLILSDTEREPIDCYIAIPQLFENADGYAIQQGAGIAVTAADDTTERACAEFLKFLSVKERNMEFATTMNYIQVTSGNLDVSLIKNTYIEQKVTEEIAKQELTDTEETRAELRTTIAARDDKVLKTYEKTAEIVESRTFWTNKPFIGSAQIRQVFEYCIQGNKPTNLGMNDLINADDYRALMKSMPESQLVNLDALLEENFNVWFNELKSIIQKLMPA